MLAVVDTGPLYAAVDSSDADHESCVAALHWPGSKLVVPALVVAEATYLSGSRMGPEVESAFLRGLGSVDVEAPNADDFRRMSDLVRQYASLPLGGTDASVIAPAERLETEIVITSTGAIFLP